MHIPPPGMVRNPGAHIDQSLDQPVDGPPHFLSSDVELPDHMQEVVGQNSHLQAGLNEIVIKPDGQGGSTIELKSHKRPIRRLPERLLVHIRECVDK